MSENRPKILIVEDEWLIAQFLEEVLRDLGFDVLGPVPSVQQALAIVSGEAPDAAILDISLGRESSLPVADELMRRNIPFVFSSGYVPGDLPAPYTGRRVLAKPISESDLRTNLCSFLRDEDRSRQIGAAP